MTSLLRTLRGEATERRPLWIMRQAGRYLPEYRALRAEHRFEELCASPELAAEVTLQPLERFPLDAAIVFADLMSPVGALGVRRALRPRSSDRPAARLRRGRDPRAARARRPRDRARGAGHVAARGRPALSGPREP